MRARGLSNEERGRLTGTLHAVATRRLTCRRYPATKGAVMMQDMKPEESRGVGCTGIGVPT